ncbi:cellulase family glycosylhydrolase [[Clostridium] polysaccharolyticum]|uniref:Cellulose binding domain-containing protein n=1 Tax=[Clostridium] polysaccharolyticum TaxID=29364 RepID=A0A1I0EZE4_9FIRM|nr:cellulase family glycosylhydrolase [[Clostridium] polysaccharolyticum]SET50311.1 Cellulose binding domain-containing protein [[Clostridium] polysaccharolyticum]
MKKSIRQCLALCLAAALAIPGSVSIGSKTVKAASSDEGFVYTQGTKFMLDGHPFYFAGCNSYDLFTLGDGWNDSTEELICDKFMNQEKIEERFALMAKNGVTVCRTWGFSSETWHGFETAPGKYNEAQFMLFDYIMSCAEKYDIKMIITLENFWDAYGGIDEKLNWAGKDSGNYKARCEWFTNEDCQKWYQNYIDHFVNRVNYFTGETYKDDPDIFAWDLMNEPRYEDYSTEEDASGKTLRKWVDASASYLKSLDPNHMVCAGIEGHEAKYGFGGNEGNPFVYLQQSPYIDFCSAHPYPSEGWAGLTPEGNAKLVRAWIKDAHEEVGKPIVIGEFNAHNNLPYEKYEAYWRSVYDTIEEEDAAGALFWEFNTFRLSPFTVMDGDKILDYFMTMSKKMQEKNGSMVTERPSKQPAVSPSAEPSKQPATSPSAEPAVIPPSPSVEPVKTPVPSASAKPVELSGAVPVVSVTTSLGGGVSQSYKITSSSSKEEIDISKVTVRFYYKKTSSKPQTFSCDNAGISLNKAPYYINYASDVKGTFYDGYLELAFTDAVFFAQGNLSMGVRFYQNDWSSYDNFKAEKVEVLYDGAVVSTEEC